MMQQHEGDGSGAFQATVQQMQDEVGEGDADAANAVTGYHLLALQKHIAEHTVGSLHGLEKDSESVAGHLKIMSWLAFLVGLGLVGVAVAGAFVEGVSTGAVLGLGGIGLVEMLGVALYRPMQRIQEAQTDLAQQTVSLRTWALATILHLRAMDVDDRDSVKEAAQAIREIAQEFNQSLEEVVEDS